MAEQGHRKRQCEHPPGQRRFNKISFYGGAEAFRFQQVAHSVLKGRESVVNVPISNAAKEKDTERRFLSDSRDAG